MRVVKALVPAAGLSRRFKGPNKLLLPWGDSTVIQTVVKTLLDSGLETLVVTGRDAQTVADLVKPAKSIFNPQFESGIGTSLAIGVQSIGECDGILVTLGDMPGLRSEVVKRLVEGFDGATIVRASYRDQPGRPSHPIIFPASRFAELAELSGDSGGQSVINSHPDLLKIVEFDGDLPDLDSMQEKKRVGDSYPSP